MLWTISLLFIKLINTGKLAECRTLSGFFGLKLFFFGHTPKSLWNDRKTLRRFGQNVLKYRLKSTVTASFDTHVAQMTEMSQQKKHVSSKSLQQLCCIVCRLETCKAKPMYRWSPSHKTYFIPGRVKPQRLALLLQANNNAAATFSADECPPYLPSNKGKSRIDQCIEVYK